MLQPIYGIDAELIISRSMEVVDRVVTGDGEATAQSKAVTALYRLCCVSSSSSPSRLTIWRKSLLFNTNGYTVYDDYSGTLVFRVDNYACDWREETYLMDSTGNVLFTIRRCKKRFGITESWEAFRGDKEESGIKGHSKPFIRATKALGSPSCKILVTTGESYLTKWSRQEGWSLLYRTRACVAPVAEVYRKYGGAAPGLLRINDVFSLMVQPGMDQAMVMAMLMIKDAMA